MQVDVGASDLAAVIGGRKKTVESEFVRFDQLSALIIDDIGAMRTALRSQLQWMGMEAIRGTSDAREAIRALEEKQYDLILCDYNLNAANSGQHFLEYLRAEKLLSYKTVFVMVTAEAEYAYVANAVEYSPDDYVLKPTQEKKLRLRLERLFERRNFLMSALRAMDEHRYEFAAEECDRLIGLISDERWIMQALRIRAEAQHALADTDGLMQTYERARALRPDTPWVGIGIARAWMLLKDYEGAARLAREIIAVSPTYVAAYELLAEIGFRKKDEDGAFRMIAAASKILPSTKRFRAAAESAYLLGKLDEAKEYSEAAIRLSSGSMTERPGDFLTLAQIQTDMGDHEGAIATLEKQARRYPETGAFGVGKNAVLSQAFLQAGNKAMAEKLLEKSRKLISVNSGSAVLNLMGRAAFKLGDEIAGLKLMTQAVQFSTEDERIRTRRHVVKTMNDAGLRSRIGDVIDAGERRIPALLEEAQKAMRVAQFNVANQKILEALDIHDENIEALLAAAQLHLLWLKQGGMDRVIDARAKAYLAKLDKLVPQNEKVMSFYRFYDTLTGGK